ncbi:MAG: peptide-N(4)-(N-acetyl-beta-glucosaminyl)asparagine amidase [Proteobacteria bacterium]|nr:peptide-N(4)-(N-acetyl-beta-glucosaminyl)asparagine amidase [Pseudomonadota bacterium]
MHALTLRAGWRGASLFAVGLLAAAAVQAAGFNEPPIPPIGTTTVATADLLVSRPSTTPCTVTLFSNQEFAGYDPVPLSYAPPAGCAGPWAKVVLEADYSVTAGRQFDRTAVINVAGVNVYFGTTMEPGSATSRAWHVERDVTDVSALLMTPQAGQAILGNTVDSTYTGRIFGTATLYFYPAGQGAPVTPSPQLVIPMAASLTSLSPSNPTLAASVTLPTNVERLYLDVIAQSQNNDEFWYTCVPDQYASVLQSCGGSAFREVEVMIDGMPAGVAPVFPWIYTGGISPYLWFPTPGVQTLNFTPSRVDLTPFAGQLDDGQPHTVALQVYGAQDYFTVTASLLAWRDAGAAVVTGSVTANTLAAPVVNVDASKLTISGSNANGLLVVSSARDYTITGTVQTSHGPVTTSVAQKMSFSNQQSFDIDDVRYAQFINQATRVRSVTTTTDATGTATQTVTSAYPLVLDLIATFPDGNEVLDTSISQTLRRVTRNVDAQGREVDDSFEDTVTPHNTTTYFAAGGSSVADSASAQHYTERKTGSGCYDRTITVTANAVSAVKDGCAR